MQKQYGLPYQGSKNLIAEWVVSHLPRRKRIYDLFCGGGAISHAALSVYPEVVASEINPLLVSALSSDEQNPYRWVTREEYRANKTTDPLLAYCWSFGANQKNYLYAEEMIPWKHALHLSRVEGDKSELDAIGVKTDNRLWLYNHTEEVARYYITWYLKEILHSKTDPAALLKQAREKCEQRNEELRLYLCKALAESGLKVVQVGRMLGTNMDRHYFGKSQWSFPTQEHYEKMQQFMPLPIPYEECRNLKGLDVPVKTIENLLKLKSFYALESQQNVNRYLAVKKIFKTDRFKLYNQSYETIAIEPNSVIYCDIPYRNTTEYTNGSGFDHEKFYDWAESQSELVVVSEYYMPPERFTCVAAVGKRNIYSSTANTLAIERLFVPNKQVELYKKSLNLLFI